MREEWMEGRKEGFYRCQNAMPKYRKGVERATGDGNRKEKESEAN
jgi:hypothetical protein